MDRIQALQELARRGKLPPDIRPVYEEAVRRGLIQGGDTAATYVQPEPPPGVMIHGGDGVSRVTGSDVAIPTPGAATTPETDVAGQAAMEAARLRSEGRDLGGVGRAFLPMQEGLGQGWGTEATAALVGPMAGIDPQVSQELFSQELAREREENKARSIGMEILGGVASGVGLAGAGGTAMRFVPQTASGLRGLGMRTAAMGADGLAMGAIYGAGANEEDRTQGAIEGGALGLGVGLATPAVTSTLGAAGNALGLTSRRSRASDRLASVTQRSGRSVDDVQARIAAALADGQDEYMVVDALGRAGRAEAGRLSRTASDVGDEIVETLTARNADAPVRVGAMVDEAATGRRGYTGAMAERDIIAARDTLANAQYAAARGNARPVNLTPTIATLDELLRRDPILGDTALSLGPLGTRLNAVRDRISRGGEQLVDFQAVVDLKSDLFQQMRRNPDAAKDLRPVYSALDAALEEASPDYRMANDSFRRASDAAEAVPIGKQMVTTGRFEDNLATYNAMPVEQQAGARVGYGSFLTDRVRQASGAEGMGNATRPILSNNARPQVEAILDPSVTRRAGREKEMFDTFAAAARGSPTAERLAEDAAGASGIAGAITDAAGMNVGGMLRRGAQFVGDRLRGENDDVRRLIAEALMTNDTDTLSMMLSSRQASAQQIDAIARALIATPAISATQQ